MAKPTMVRVDPGELQVRISRIVELAETIDAAYADADNAIEELGKYWVGADQKEFMASFRQVQTDSKQWRKWLKRYVSESLRFAAREYTLLNLEIASKVQELMKRKA